MTIEIPPILLACADYLTKRIRSPQLKQIEKAMSRDRFRTAVVDLLHWLRNGPAPRNGPLRISDDPSGVTPLEEFLSHAQSLADLFVLRGSALTFRSDVPERARRAVVSQLREYYKPPARHRRC